MRDMNLGLQYIIYLIRWQLSTPILAIVLQLLGESSGTPWIPTIIANFIGGLIFFWVDKFIFKPRDRRTLYKRFGKSDTLDF